MRNRLRFTMAIVAGIVLLVSGCYKEERLGMPEKGEVPDLARDSMPNPFDGSNRVYLIKDGVPDYTKMSVMGFTDFAVEMPAGQSSWYQGNDDRDKQYFGCRQHRNFYALDVNDHFGGNQLSYEYNALTSRLFLKNGAGKNWKMTARMALEEVSHNVQSMFAFEGALGYSKRSRFLFDWTSGLNSYLFMGRASQQYALDGGAVISTWKYIAPNDPFDFVICCVDNYYYVQVNGETIWAYDINDGAEHSFPLVFRPWMSGVRFYDLAIEGDYDEHQPVGVQQQNGYASIQAPALTAAGSEVWLFAEGRRENRIQSNRLTNIRSNATDLLLRRSPDGGANWEEWTLLKGGDQEVYLRPEVIRAGERIYLFYTVDVTGKQDGHYRMEYIVSDDNARTWSEAVVLPLELEGFTLSTLSGHGIQCTDGRLAFPVQCRKGSKGTIAVVYSTDQGAHWTLGEPVEGLRNQYANLLEVDGKLVMYLGHSSVGASRKTVRSEDGGQSWSVPVDATIPSGKSGQQSYGATIKSEDGKIYHFTPTEIEKTSLFSGSSVSTDPLNGSAAQKKLYIYQPACELLGKGLTMTVSGNGGVDWSAAENLVGFTSYTEYTFPVGAMDAAISGNKVLLVVESGCAVPYEGLLLFTKQLGTSVQ